MTGVVSRLVIAPIRFYRSYVSPMRPAACRFYPTCSQYAMESIQVHGVLRGGGYAVVRLLKCGPWHPGGIDKVRPPRRTTQSFSSTATTE